MKTFNGLFSLKWSKWQRRRAGNSLEKDNKYDIGQRTLKSKSG